LGNDRPASGGREPPESTSAQPGASTELGGLTPPARRESVHTFRASDGYHFYYRRYAPPGTPKARLVFVHGIRSHGGWYTRSCAAFAAAGFDVTFLDRRGAGLNTTRRGDCPGFRRLLDDVAEFVQNLRAERPWLPVYLAGISSVEQPVRHEEVDRLTDIRKQVKTPIMLDESLCSRADAERAVADGLCDLFNLRLSKCGGFIPTLRLAQLARRHGLGYQLGCQVGETAVLSAAGRHFAAGVAGLRYLEGSYDRHLVRTALATRDITFRRGGWAQALPGPGLGIDLDARALDRVTVRKESLL